MFPQGLIPGHLLFLPYSGTVGDFMGLRACKSLIFVPGFSVEPRLACTRWLLGSSRSVYPDLISTPPLNGFSSEAPTAQARNLRGTGLFSPLSRSVKKLTLLDLLPNNRSDVPLLPDSFTLSYSKSPKLLAWVTEAVLWLVYPHSCPRSFCIRKSECWNVSLWPSESLFTTP